MTKERYNQIKANTQNQADIAEEVLNGENEYDGADGARYISRLCQDMEELLSEVDETKLTV